jgi:hypothetical protein
MVIFIKNLVQDLLSTVLETGTITPKYPNKLVVSFGANG